MESKKWATISRTCQLYIFDKPDSKLEIITIKLHKCFLKNCTNYIKLKHNTKTILIIKPDKDILQWIDALRTNMGKNRS
jgi:hypothetical protein